MKKVIMYEQIYKEIINSIQNGEYKEKDLLPSEKDLAEQYGVSRITTNKAMNLLAKNGVIERVQGKGSFVSINAVEVTKAAELEEPIEVTSDLKQVPIGVIVDNFDVDWGSSLVKGIERECRRRNFSMFFYCTYGNVEEENKGIQTALNHGAKGLILMPVQGEKYNVTILKLALNKFPVILVDRDMKGIGIPCVKTDNYAASREMTEILIRQGHHRICFVTHMLQTTPTIEDRFNAFRDCIMEHPDCRGTVELVQGYNPTPENSVEEYMDYDLSEIKKIIEKEKECTAFFAVEYKIAVLFKCACEELRIKKEICTFDGLIGIYGDQNHFMHVKQGEYQIGVEAVRTLQKVMDGVDTDMTINIPYKVVM